MRIILPTYQRSVRLQLGVQVDQPMNLMVRVTDPTKHHTCYIRRRIPFSSRLFEENEIAPGYRTISVPLPQSPHKAALEVLDYDYVGDHRFEVKQIKAEPLPPVTLVAEPEIQRFVNFAQSMARDLGFLQPGFYDAPGHEFLIQVLDVIRDQQGRPLQTPARISQMTSRIQVSKRHFEKYTIPVRLFILLHERFHWQLPTRREKPADMAALRIYLDLGYPKTEALYAATKVFLDHPGPIGKEVFERMKSIDQYNRFRQRTSQTSEIHTILSA